MNFNSKKGFSERTPRVKPIRKSHLDVCQLKRSCSSLAERELHPLNCETGICGRRSMALGGKMDAFRPSPDFDIERGNIFVALLSGELFIYFVSPTSPMLSKRITL
ncbi:hypothetical protein CEXT_80591 [Caerostris extrusa]|uniref:Uncharacterized protein n=1 Tax=Caerostris extrusa TaxID=172846 RepID=A0AAV4TLS2_CAEEX|nr:hypothetical protein CEXT_80591 [Caerostris extrusa]